MLYHFTQSTLSDDINNQLLQTARSAVAALNDTRMHREDTHQDVCALPSQVC